MDATVSLEQKSSKERTKRRIESSDSPEGIADKRRRQNRFSQREHRKKQNAYIQNIESFMQVMKDSNEMNDNDSKYSRLLKAHTELIEENRRLRDTVSAVRRKLLHIVDQLTSTGMKLDSGRIQNRRET